MTEQNVKHAGTAALRGHSVPTSLFIGGAWRDTGATFPVINPASGETIAELADAGAQEALAALDSASAAQADWAAVTPRRRADLFHAAHRRMIGQRQAFIDVMALESGKPVSEAAAEFDLSAGFFLWYAEQIAHLHGTYAPGSNSGYRIITTLHPVGPSLLITPWNFPLLMIVRKAGAALAAGCTVITKSARETPLTSALFVQCLLDAGLPPGAINLLHTSRSAAISEPLLADKRLRKVSFTGSTAVGATLLGHAAGNIVNASMELGGDGPFIVLDDADIDLAVEQAIICKFRNAGQACVAANRIILHRDIAEAFERKFVERARELRVGDAFDPATDVGPIISESQRRRVISLVEQLTASGGELLLGGKPVPGPGYFFEPTVLRIDAAAHECGQELFAPIATLFTVDSAAEAVAFANTTDYGLAAYVFTRSIDRAIVLAEKLEFGMVGVNRGIMADPAAPFGGTKASGLGREGGHDGIHEFLEPKYLALTVNEEQGLAS